MAIMTPPEPLSEEKIEEFRSRLTAVATRLFAEHGYEGVTLRAIASELGCSPMTPYRYFRDKGEIFAAVRAAAYGRFTDTQNAALEAGGDVVERIRRLGRAYVAFGIEEPDAYRLMFELGQPDAEKPPVLLDAELDSWRPLRSVVGEAIAAGHLVGDPDTLAHVFWVGVHGLVSLHLAGKLNLGKAVDALLDPLLDTLFRGNARA